MLAETLEQKKMKIRIVCIIALISILSSCQNTLNGGMAGKMSDTALLFCSAGENKPMDLLDFNESEMSKGNTSMSSANNQPIYGVLKGLVVGMNGIGYCLTSSPDAMAAVEMERYKVIETSLISELSSPQGLTLSGNTIYILNDGDAATGPYISVYDVVGSNYTFKYHTKIMCKDGRMGNSIQVIGEYCYVGTDSGIDMYELSSGTYSRTIDTPAAVLDFLTDDSSLIVSLRDFGIGIYDTTIEMFTMMVEFPIGEKGQLVFGKDQLEVLAYSDSAVFSVNIMDGEYDVLFTGENISGVERSDFTRNLFVANKGGTNQIVLNVAGEILANFTAPEGEYVYVFVKKQQ